MATVKSNFLKYEDILTHFNVPVTMDALLHYLEQDYADTCYGNCQLYIDAPDQHDYEIIIVSIRDFKKKAEYIRKAYTDDLKLRAAHGKVWIANFDFNIFDTNYDDVEEVGR